MYKTCINSNVVKVFKVIKKYSQRDAISRSPIHRRESMHLVNSLGRQDFQRDIKHTRNIMTFHLHFLGEYRSTLLCVFKERNIIKLSMVQHLFRFSNMTINLKYDKESRIPQQIKSSHFVTEKLELIKKSLLSILSYLLCTSHKFLQSSLSIMFI